MSQNYTLFCILAHIGLMLSYFTYLLSHSLIFMILLKVDNNGLHGPSTYDTFTRNIAANGAVHGSSGLSPLTR